MHGISPEQWEMYVEGVADPATRDFIEAHLTGCLVCWEQYEALQLSTQELRRCGARARYQLPLRDAELHQGLQRAFAKLRTAEQAVGTQAIQQRLEELAQTLATMCGTTTAARVLQLAAQASSAQSLARVSPENWDSFLARLTSLATVMCGETGAHLVRESGQW